MDHSIILSPLNVPDILHKYGIKPDKRLGQNFLIDNSALLKVIQAAQITTQDYVLEIGAGIGSLTRQLALRAHRVVTVELDKKLLAPLQEVIAPFSNIHLIRADILEIDLGKLFEKPGYLVLGNIPYYITSAVIRHLMEAEVRPMRVVLTVQREVAQRICALPGNMSLLALSVQVFGKPKITAQIPAGSFYPPPKVDSAIVRIDIYSQPLISEEQLDTYFRLIKFGFSQKRKTLRNALAAGLGWVPREVEFLLEKARVEPHRRAETLSIDEWQQVISSYLLSKRQP